MKIDIENILYIIVIIVWVIVGLIRKKKTKEGRPETAMPPLGETQSPDISEMLEEILGKKRAETVKPEPSPAKQKKTVPEISAQPQTLESIHGTDVTRRSIKKTTKAPGSQTVSPKQAKTAVAAAKDQQDEAPLDENNIRSIIEESQFDLRKAVIYSEILKPPYQ